MLWKPVRRRAGAGRANPFERSWRVLISFLRGVGSKSTKSDATGRFVPLREGGAWACRGME